MQDANLVEVFSSVQGEGPYVGTSTLFIRLGECDLRCRWCDSPQTWRPARRARVECARGSGRFEARANPVSCEEIVGAAERLELAAHRFVSLTGGEPLLQPGAVAEIATHLAGRGPRIHLETHGLAPRALERVREHLDVVSMDWKLSSDVQWADAVRAPEFDAVHEDFLRLAHEAAETWVKVVVTTATRDDEVDALAARIASVSPAIPLVVQPVTPTKRVPERPSADRLLALARRLEATLHDVRLIPQTHPVYGAL